MSRLNQPSYSANRDYITPYIIEKSETILDESGYRMQVDEIAFNQIDLRWGAYVNPSEKTLHLKSDKAAIVSHFQLYDSVLDSKRESLKEKEFIVYKQTVEDYELSIAPTNNSERKYFELIMSEQLFNNFLNAESDFLYRFQQNQSGSFISTMAPAMYLLINDMKNTHYQGHLKGLYLESKAIELFLMQIAQLDWFNENKSKLTHQDINCLHDIKQYLDNHYLNANSMSDLSKKAGINQSKLKSGFKQLFNNTVFGYIRDLRLNEAKRLLTRENLYVNEVADLAGYKHPHHFTVAFKKKFGIYPSTLKEI